MLCDIFHDLKFCIAINIIISVAINKNNFDQWENMLMKRKVMIEKDITGDCLDEDIDRNDV